MSEQDTPPDFEREQNEVVTRLDAIARNLAILQPRAQGLLELPNLARVSTHIKMRVHSLTFTCTAAAIVTVTIGSVARSFSLPGGDTRTIPFLFTIDRGVDVSISSTAGTPYGFLIYEAG